MEDVTPARNVIEAADALLRSSADDLTMIAKHDPDMIRDVAAALIARRHALADAVRATIVRNGRISYPSRMGVKNLAEAVAALIMES